MHYALLNTKFIKNLSLKKGNLTFPHFLPKIHSILIVVLFTGIKRSINNNGFVSAVPCFMFFIITSLKAISKDHKCRYSVVKLRNLCLRPLPAAFSVTLPSFGLNLFRNNDNT